MSRKDANDRISMIPWTNIGTKTLLFFQRNICFFRIIYHVNAFNTVADIDEYLYSVNISDQNSDNKYKFFALMNSDYLSHVLPTIYISSVSVVELAERLKLLLPDPFSTK